MTKKDSKALPPAKKKKGTVDPIPGKPFGQRAQARQVDPIPNDDDPFDLPRRK
jgi:hypothetical protein